MLSRLFVATAMLISTATVSSGGNPFVQQKVFLQGGHCVTPVQTYSSPVYSYSAPSYAQPVVQQAASYNTNVVAADQSAYNGDVSQALQIIAKFKLQQQVLDDGLSAMGYGTPNQVASQVAGQPAVTYGYAQQAPVVNYGLAPFSQGTTQYQVESLQVSSFGQSSDTIAESLNSLARLADNMQKGSVTVSASVGGSVQSLSNAVQAQTAGNVEVAKIQAEAASRIAMLQAAAKLVEDTRPSSQFDATLNAVTPQTDSTEIGDAVSIQTVDPVLEVDAASIESVRANCFGCHSGDTVKGDWTLDGGLTQDNLVKAAASVLAGTMPKNKPNLTTEQRLQVVRELHSLVR